MLDIKLTDDEAGLLLTMDDKGAEFVAFEEAIDICQNPDAEEVAVEYQGISPDDSGRILWAWPPERYRLLRDILSEVDTDTGPNPMEVDQAIENVEEAIRLHELAAQERQRVTEAGPLVEPGQ